MGRAPNCEKSLIALISVTGRKKGWQCETRIRSDVCNREREKRDRGSMCLCKIEGYIGRERVCVCVCVCVCDRERG